VIIIIVMSLTYSGGGVTPQPKLAWDFEGTTTDYVSGVAPTTTVGAPTYVTGKYGQAINFPNTGGGTSTNYLRYTIPSVVLTTSSVSVSVWVNISTFANYENIIGISTGSGSANYIEISTLSGGYIYIRSAKDNLNIDSPTVNIGTWYNVCMVINAGTISGYLNGVSFGTFTSTDATSFTNLFVATVNTFNGFKGSVDDLRIFDQALTSAQVQAVYAAQGMPGRGVQVKTAPAYTVSDQSPSPLTLSTYGSATSNTNSPFGGTEGSIENLNYSIPSSVSKTNFSFWGSNCFIEFWMYLSGTNSGNPRIIERGNYPNSEYSVFMNASSGGYYLKFSYGSNVPFAFQFVPGTWNHFSFSYNYATQTLYGSINGSVASGGTTAGITYSSGSSVNLYPSGGGYVIDISNLRVVTGATTLPYISNFTVPTAPLSIYPTGTTALLLRSVSPGTTLTGTPLFSQLSQAATSSAVGAFSLRAVNGSSVKAVAVQAHPVVQWPPVAMTSNTTVVSSQLYGNGTYIASDLSGGVVTTVFRLFDNDINTKYEQYFTGSNYYDFTLGTLIDTTKTTTVSGAVAAGWWVQLQLPTAIILRSYTLIGRQDSGLWNVRNPTTFWIAGSTDGTTWSNVHFQSGISYGQSGTTISVPQTSNSLPYSYYRLIVNVIGNPGASGNHTTLDFATWNLYGDSSSYAPNAAQDFYADRLGNLLTAPVTGQSLANWLGGATGYVATWYDQSGAGQHMAQTTASLQPIISLATTPASLILSGTEYFQNTVPFTFNFGSGAFTLRYVVSNNTGGLVVYKANGNDFVWSGNEKKFWLGNGTSTETSQGGYPSQVGNSENYILAGAPAIGSTKTSVVHKATSTTAIPIYVNGTIQTLATNALTMGTDPGNFLYFGKGGNASNYIGNLHEIEIFSTAFSDTDRLVLEN
jgi:hypothetical protein